MAQTQQKRRSPVVPAVLLFAVSAAAFGFAFYYLDGVQYARSLYERVTAFLPAVGAEPTSTVEPTATAGVLVLPQGVDEKFALRTWQEQVDSQANIKRLVDGEIAEMTFGQVAPGGYEGSVEIEVKFKDGTRAPGVLHMAKKGESWYFQHITGLRRGATGPLADTTQAGTDTPPVTPLPTLDKIDTGVLQTIFREQVRSQDVFRDYLQGNVRRVVITDIERGPGTATIRARMEEKEHTVDAQIVVITRTVDGKALWFLTKFTKVATVPKT